MVAIIFTVILIFFALLGLAALVDGAVGWLSQSGSLAGCTLTVILGNADDAELVESKLLHAERLALTHRFALRVVCGVDCPAFAIAERFCNDKGIALDSNSVNNSLDI